MWKAVCLLALLISTGCEPLDVGDPPTFAGITSAAAVGESQILLRWSAGSDDFLKSTELVYGIWFAKSGESINPEASPNLVTGEGALSYTVTGLTAATSYSFLVRASDRGSDYSENTQQTSASTSAAGSGLFATEKTLDVDRVIEGMVGGPAFSGGADDIGLIDGQNIIWYESGTNGTLSLKSTNTAVGADIVQAVLAPIRSNTASDLLVLTANAFYYYPNNNGNLSFDRSSPFGSVAKKDTISLTRRAGSFRYLCFVDSAGDGQIWSLTSSSTWRRAETLDLPTDTAFAIDFLNADDKPDQIRLNSSGLAVFLGEGDELDFGSESRIDSLSYDPESHSLRVLDYNSDGFSDLLVFERNSSSRITKIHFFQGKGDGTFASKTTVDYLSAIYADPRFIDIGGNTTQPELVFTQTSSNNLVIYASGSFDTIETAVGNSGLADFSYAGDIDGNGSNDVVFFSSAAKKLTLVQRIASKKR